MTGVRFHFDSVSRVVEARSVTHNAQFVDPEVFSSFIL